MAVLVGCDDRAVGRSPLPLVAIASSNPVTHGSIISERFRDVDIVGAIRRFLVGGVLQPPSDVHTWRGALSISARAQWVEFGDYRRLVSRGEIHPSPTVSEVCIVARARHWVRRRCCVRKTLEVTCQKAELRQARSACSSAVATASYGPSSIDIKPTSCLLVTSSFLMGGLHTWSLLCVSLDQTQDRLTRVRLALALWRWASPLSVRV